MTRGIEIEREREREREKSILPNTMDRPLGRRHGVAEGTRVLHDGVLLAPAAVAAEEHDGDAALVDAAAALLEGGRGDVPRPDGG